MEPGRPHPIIRSFELLTRRIGYNSILPGDISENTAGLEKPAWLS